MCITSHHNAHLVLISSSSEGEIYQALWIFISGYRSFRGVLSAQRAGNLWGLHT